jgi:hypothetical protein|tara:strand:+ start:216 stop:386 length:171 start_codon:yes stop_codon:yes gene_type:complete
MKKIKFPKLPANKKPKLFYKSNQYINAVWWDKEVIEYYLWDEVASTFNEVLRFHRL